ncbi:MAG: HAMP domain-containing histidine kinase [Frankiaceae bacterium]|nr:HAMP domain-containing histidine kinase [Frankiaceae bacterium]
MRLGLRARAGVVFAAGALVVSASLATATYELTRQSLLAERERTATRAAYFDAAVVRQGLATDTADIVDVLRTLDTGQGRRPLIFKNDRWFARTADTGITAAVPRSLRTVVARGLPGVQRVRLNGTPTLVVGVPLRGTSADYFELTTQTELERTLRQLGLTLAVVAIATTVAGAALGVWASRRIMRPIVSIADTARTIAAGDLTRRLDPDRDPDLAPLTASFNEMVDELAGRIDRDRRFAADVSHELRSPLQTLTAASAVLANRRDQFDVRSAAATDLVVAEVDRFNTLVTDLLALARGDRPVDLQPLEVSPLVRAACHVNQVGPDRVHVDGALIWPLDARRFEQVLSNLLENAQRHGGGATAVTCGVVDESLRLVVDDSGPGVPVEERGMIFDRFGRGRRASARGGGSAHDGTGLGLALVAQHVADHGGSVAVLDAPGGGARFVVTLPRSTP